MRRVAEHKLPQFNSDLPQREYLQEPLRNPFSQRFDQFRGRCPRENAHLFRDHCVVNRPANIVAEIFQWLSRPEHDADGKALDLRSFFFRHSNMRPDFQLRDVQVIRVGVYVLFERFLIIVSRARPIARQSADRNAVGPTQARDGGLHMRDNQGSPVFR